MKKIKYLLWLTVVWIWLLFNNYIFAFWSTTISSVYIDWIALPSISSSTNYYSYLYTFTEYAVCDRSYCSSNLSYSTLKDWVSTQYYPLWQVQNCDSSTLISNTPFNNSAWAYEPYNWYFRDILWNWRCYWYFWNMIPYWWTFPVKVSLWVWDQFWKAFIYTNDLLNNTWVYSPHYSLWNWFFSNENYLTYNTDSSNSNLNYFRFFYDQLLFANPLDTQNLVSSSNSQNWSWLVAWQYFNWTNVQYQTQYNTNRLYIWDYWSQFLAWAHFWGYGMWYSSALDTAWTSFISWRDFTFQSVWSKWIESAMKLWTTSYDFLKDNKVINLWILVLKWDSYVTRNNNASVVLLSKNPNNVKQILYEQFDCAYDDLSYIFNTEYCNSISHWYIKHDWSDEILPFTWFNDVYTVWNWNWFLDLLLGDWTYWYISMSNNQYCLNSSSKQYCFSLTTRPNDVSLKELYLQNSLNTPTSDNINGQLANRCLSDSNFAFLNPILCNYYNNLFSTTTALGSWYYYQYSVDSGWNITMEIIDQAWLFDGHTWYVWLQDENWNWVTNCDGGWCNPNPTNSSWSVYLSWDILSTWYYDISSSIFFGCPYPYDPIFTLGGWDLKLWRFDIVWPINCFISAFNHWKSFNFLDNVWLFNFWPLFSWNTQQHRILFRFFDILLAFGMLLLVRFIYKLFK